MQLIRITKNRTKMMTTNIKLLAFASLTLGAILPIQAGTIKGSFVTAKSTVVTAGTATSTPASATVVSVAISQRGKSIRKVIVNTVEATGTYTFRTTETFFPFGREFFVEGHSSETNSAQPTYLDKRTLSIGTGKFRAKVSASRGKGKTSKGGMIRLTFKKDPSMGVNNDGFGYSYSYIYSRTTEINATLGKRGKMSFKDVVGYSSANSIDGPYADVTTTIGSGKATGKITN